MNLRQRLRDERGSIAVEVAVIAPALVFLMLLVVYAGKVSEADGNVERAASDAARAASLRQDPGDATTDAQDTAVSDGAISRNAIWSDTLILVKSHPMVGTGIGAFGTAFASVTRSSGAAVVLHAHSDALQIVADAGAIGAGLAILFVAGLGFSARKGSRAEDPVLRGVALGAAAGCFGLFVHSWVDFNLQIPSNALAALFVAALMIRASGIDGVPVGLVPRSRT